MGDLKPPRPPAYRHARSKHPPLTTASIEGSSADSADDLARQLDYAPIAYLTLNKGGRILYMNRAASALLNLDASESKGLALASLFAKNGDATILSAAIEAVIATREPQRVDLLLAQTSGPVRHIRIKLASTPKVAGLQAVLIDIETLVAGSAAVHAKDRAEQINVSVTLHEGLAQELTALGLSLTALKLSVKAGRTLALEDFERLNSIIRHSIITCRDLVRQLLPVGAHTGDLQSVLHALVERSASKTGPRITFITAHRQPLDLPASTEDHLYHIVEEALHNALRLAKATAIEVRLRVQRNFVVLEVRDDGIGLDTTVPGKGSGLLAMSHRATAVDGRLTFKRNAKGGITVHCICPRPK